MFLQHCLLLWPCSFWWNHDQWSSMFIQKKSSHSVSSIKCRTFAMLLRQQFLWGVLMAIGIGKLWGNWNNGSTICMSNALDLFPVQSNMMTALFLEKNTFDIFEFMLYSMLVNPSAWFSAEKQAFVNILTSLLFLILSLASGSSKIKAFDKNCTTF